MVINIDAINPDWPRTIQIDESLDVEKQTFSRTGPPGPPPRKGLEWKEETHRWVRATEAELPSDIPNEDRTPATISDEKTRTFTEQLEGFNSSSPDQYNFDLSDFQTAYSLPDSFDFSTHISGIGWDPNVGINGHLYVQVDIMNKENDRRINVADGRMVRHFSIDDENRLKVEHASFFIKPEFQNQGIASSLGEHLENAYRDMGGEYIELDADGDVGKYTWAVQGYDFVEEDDFLRINQNISFRLEHEIFNEEKPKAPRNPVSEPQVDFTRRNPSAGFDFDLGSNIRLSELLDSENFEYVPFIPDAGGSFKNLNYSEIPDGKARYEHGIHSWQCTETLVINGEEVSPRILFREKGSSHGRWFLDLEGPKADEVIDYGYLRNFAQRIDDIGISTQNLKRSDLDKIWLSEDDVQDKLNRIEDLLSETRDFYHPWEFAAWNPFNEELGEHFGKRYLLDKGGRFEVPQWKGIKYLSDEDQPSYEMSKIYWETKKAVPVIEKQSHPDGDTTPEEPQINEVGEYNDDLGDLKDPDFEASLLQGITELMANRPLNDKILDSVIDRHLTEHKGLLEKQQAPGPPPRPGLTWKPQTHRWIRPNGGEDESNAPRGRSGEQWWKPDQEGDERPILTADNQRIPPAWTDLWVNADPSADRLAVGIDVKGRSQTTYSMEYGKKQSAKKFARIRSFAKGHKKLTAQIGKDIDNGNEEAIVASLINQSFIRPGSEVDTGAEKKAYGATTLLTDHVSVKGDEITLAFDSKKGGHTVRTIKDKRLASILNDRVDKRQPGAKLFDTDASKVNDYVQKTAIDIGMPGADNLKYTIKDFRTHGATNLAVQEMNSGKHSMAPPPTAEQIQKKIDSKNKARTVPPAIPNKKKKTKGKLETNAKFKERVDKAKDRRAKWKQQEPLQGDDLRAEIINQFDLALNKAKKPIAEVVSEQLQNTPAMAIKSYMSPHVFEDWNNTYEDTQRRVTNQLMGE